MDLQIEKGKLKEYFSDKKNCRRLIIYPEFLSDKSDLSDGSDSCVFIFC